MMEMSSVSCRLPLYLVGIVTLVVPTSGWAQGDTGTAATETQRALGAVGAPVPAHFDASQTITFASRCVAADPALLAVPQLWGHWKSPWITPDDRDANDVAFLISNLVLLQEKLDEGNAWHQQASGEPTKRVGDDLSVLLTLAALVDGPFDEYLLLEPVPGGRCSLTVSLVVVHDRMDLKGINGFLKEYVHATNKSWGLFERAVEKDRLATAREQAAKKQAAIKAERTAAKRERRPVSPARMEGYAAVTEHHEYRNAAVAHLNTSFRNHSTRR